MDLPVLPGYYPTIDVEGDAFGLGDVEGFEVGAEATFFFDCGWVIVVWWSSVDWSSDWWDIDVDDLLQVAVVDGSEVQGEGVLIVVHVGAIVHQCLL